MFANSMLTLVLLGILTHTGILQEKLSEQEKVDMFGATYKATPPDTPDKLLAQPSFKAHMEAVHESLIRFCSDVVVRLEFSLWLH